MNIKSIRKDWELIQKLIEKDRTVLDIGCGDGGLIKKLMKDNNSKAQGLEIDGNLVRDSISSGLIVVQGNAEKDLDQYNDESFDYVIASNMIHHIPFPIRFFKEMNRILKRAISSMKQSLRTKIPITIL